MDKNLIIFDTETTGFNPGQIIQISYILVENRKISAKNFFFIVDKVSKEAEEVHGFSLDKIKKLTSRKFEDDSSEILIDFQSSNIIIGHNVSFDKRFMDKEYSALHVSSPINDDLDDHEIFCIMKEFKEFCGAKDKNGRLKNPSLSDLIKKLNISESKIKSYSKFLFNKVPGPHDARFDASATFLCYIKYNLIKKMVKNEKIKSSELQDKVSELHTGLDKKEMDEIICPY